MTGSHLNNGNIMLFVQTEKCLGNPYVVVEVPLRVENVILFRQHRSHQFLGGSLTIGASNGNDRDIELSAVFTSQIFEGLQTVVNFYNPRKEGGGRRKEITLGDVLVNDGISTSFLQSLYGEFVTIERFAFEGEEDTSFGTVTTVGSDTRMLLVQLI
jgi:hypothetical protein